MINWKGWGALVLLIAVAAVFTSVPLRVRAERAGASRGNNEVAERQAAQNQARSPKGTIVISPAVVLARVSLPAIGYDIALPEGWVTTPPAGFSIAATPAGRPTPMVYFVIGVPVSDIDFNLMLNSCNRAVEQNPLTVNMTMCTVRAGQTQIADSQYRWSPQQAVEKLLQALQGTGPSQMIGTPEFHSVSPSEALYRFTVSKNGQSLVQWGHATMSYLPNPLLSRGLGAPPGVTSLLFATGCEVPSIQASDPNFTAACSAIAHSFRPEQGFVERLVDSIESSYQNEVNALATMGRQTIRNLRMRSQMINETISTVRDLQWRTFNAQQQSQLKIAEGWMNTYAGTQDFIDPGSGHEYNFATKWRNYRYSCISANEQGYFSNQLNCAELSGKLGIFLHSISPVQ